MRGVEQTFLLSLLEKFLWCRDPWVSPTEPDPYAALVFHPLEAEPEGHHYKFMVTSNISSWKAPGLCNVCSWLEASLDHKAVDLIVVVSSCAVPCPASRWFVWTKYVRYLQIVVTGEFYEPPASFVRLRVAILVSPISAFQSPCTTRMSYFCAWSIISCSWS